MGGTAYIIHGELAEARLEPVALPRNLLDRLLGRTRHAQPRETRMPRGFLMDVPCTELKVVGEEFLRFLKGRFAEPSSSDAWVVSYLEQRTMTTYLRGERAHEDEPYRWYFQMTFSGCAGMTEVSAAVSRHWFGQWYAANAVDLAQRVFIPWGFIPGAPEEDDTPDLFLPVDDLGYASFDAPSGTLELDASFTEDESGMEAEARLNREYAGLFKDRQCRCSFCTPGYKATGESR